MRKHFTSNKRNKIKYVLGIQSTIVNLATKCQSPDSSLNVHSIQYLLLFLHLLESVGCIIDKRKKGKEEEV